MRIFFVECSTYYGYHDTFDCGNFLCLSDYIHSGSLWQKKGFRTFERKFLCYTDLIFHRIYVIENNGLCKSEKCFHDNDDNRIVHFVVQQYFVRLSWSYAVSEAIRKDISSAVCI